jgi:hypothetical protein
LPTPGLIDAVLKAFELFKSASKAAAANFPSGPTIFEITRTTGGTLFDPNYVTPYSFQVNARVQREIRPGLVLSVDYLRNRGVHSILRRDFNRLGAADTLNIANARAAMIGTHTAFSCPENASSATVDCAITAGATIEDYAANGLGSAGGASLDGPNTFAIPGANPNFNSMQLLGMQGLSTYNALQVSLRGGLPDVGRAVRDWTVIASYSLSRFEGTSDDQAFLTNSVNNDNIHEFFGPSTLDRTHMLSFGTLFRIPGGVRLNREPCRRRIRSKSFSVGETRNFRLRTGVSSWQPANAPRVIRGRPWRLSAPYSHLPEQVLIRFADRQRLAASLEL